MNHTIFYKFLLLSGTALILTSCQSAPVALTAPADAPQAVAVPVEPVGVAGTESTLSHNLEGRVKVLEDKMRDAEPRLKKIDVIESHFHALSLELKNLAVAPDAVPADTVGKNEVVQSTSKPSSVAKKEPMVAKKVDKPASAPMPMAKDNAVTITSVRMGEQSGKTVRIVLDATQSAEMHYDLDNTEGLLVIDLPKTKWAAGKPSLPKKSSFIQSVDTKTDESGSHLIVQVTGKAKVVATGRLNPSGKLGHRVYLDIAPAATK